ncbi:MAG: hypothetical protein Q7K57_11800 [Burkholderiaceae bacterium]|nr:hypothetical protein [Burkholderiaceae bacterium]
MALDRRVVASIAIQTEAMLTKPPADWVRWSPEQTAQFKCDIETLRQALRRTFVSADALRDEVNRVGRWYGSFIEVPMEIRPRRLRKGRLFPSPFTSTFGA